MPTLSKRRLLQEYAKDGDLYGDQLEYDEDQEEDQDDELDELDEEDFEESLPSFDWNIQKMRFRETPEPIIQKKYVGFNWWTYSASALGTFLILWWGLK